MGVPTTEAEVDAAEGLGSAAWIRSTAKIDGIREIKKQRRSIGKAFLGKAFTTTLRIVLGDITSLFQKRLSCQTAEENDPDLICSLSVAVFTEKRIFGSREHFSIARGFVDAIRKDSRKLI
jgi:hypothetical protein